jgi:hypothetical protein
VVGYKVDPAGHRQRDLSKKDAAEMLLAADAAMGREWPKDIKTALLKWNGGPLDVDMFKKRYGGIFDNLKEINPKALQRLLEKTMPAIAEKARLEIPLSFVGTGKETAIDPETQDEIPF